MPGAADFIRLSPTSCESRIRVKERRSCQRLYLEIGGQVEQSSKIGNLAVVEADRTNSTVEGLHQTAQRIGVVVQLIDTITGQTNLLAFAFRMSSYIKYLRKRCTRTTRGIPTILQS